MNNSQGQARAARGFTLIELLVVLVILGLLASLVGPQLIGRLGQAKSDTAKLQIEQLSSALDVYKLDVGQYPTEEQGLKALVEKPRGVGHWNGPYLEEDEVPQDPWGHPYHYEYPGEHGRYDLYSLGSDNARGGTGEDADLGSWE